MSERTFSAGSLAWRLTMASHLVFLFLAAAVLAATIEAVADAELVWGWRSMFLPFTILQNTTQFLAYAWFAMLARGIVLALAPAARPAGEGTLAAWMERNCVGFFWFLLVLAAAGAAGALVNLWSLREAAPLQTLSRSLITGSSELFYAAVLGFLARGLAVARTRGTA